MAALAAGNATVSYQLPVLAWLDIIAEIKDRHPRNYSSLLRDDMMERLENAIERLHEETTFVIAHGPADVSQRVSAERAQMRRDVASAELKRSIKNMGKDQ